MRRRRKRRLPMFVWATNRQQIAHCDYAELVQWCRSPARQQVSQDSDVMHQCNITSNSNSNMQSNKQTRQNYGQGTVDLVQSVAALHKQGKQVNGLATIDTGGASGRGSSNNNNNNNDSNNSSSSNNNNDSNKVGMWMNKCNDSFFFATFYLIMLATATTTTAAAAAYSNNTSANDTHIVVATSQQQDQVALVNSNSFTTTPATARQIQPEHNVGNNAATLLRTDAALESSHNHSITINDNNDNRNDDYHSITGSIDGEPSEAPKRHNSTTPEQVDVGSGEDFFVHSPDKDLSYRRHLYKPPATSGQLPDLINNGLLLINEDRDLTKRELSQVPITTTIEALVGQRVQLPCNLMPHMMINSAASLEGPPSTTTTTTMSSEYKFQQTEQQLPTTATKTRISSSMSHYKATGGQQQQQQDSFVQEENLIGDGFSGSAGAVNGADDHHQSILAHSSDKIKLIFWYKDDQAEPIYTIDARPLTSPDNHVATTSNGNNDNDNNNNVGPHNGDERHHYQRNKQNSANSNNKNSNDIPVTLLRARHFIGSQRVDNQQKQHRQVNYAADGHHDNNDYRRHFLYFNMTQYPMAYLTINSVNRSDAGHYRCRIDYKLARTINQNSRLNVIVPVSKVEILNLKSSTSNSPQVVQPNAIIGPYNEGDSLEILCRVPNGWPVPSLSWLRMGSQEPLASGAGDSSGELAPLGQDNDDNSADDETIARQRYAIQKPSDSGNNTALERLGHDRVTTELSLSSSSSSSVLTISPTTSDSNSSDSESSSSSNGNSNYLPLARVINSNANGKNLSDWISSKLILNPLRRSDFKQVFKCQALQPLPTAASANNNNRASLMSLRPREHVIDQRWTPPANTVVGNYSNMSWQSAAISASFTLDMNLGPKHIEILLASEHDDAAGAQWLDYASYAQSSDAEQQQQQQQQQQRQHDDADDAMGKNKKRTDAAGATQSLLINKKTVGKQSAGSHNSNNNNNSKSLLAQQRAQFICQARGSRPPAIISWHKENSGPIEGIGQSMSKSGFVTTSILNFVVKPEDNGQKLTCEAKNQELSMMAKRHQMGSGVRPLQEGVVTTHVVLNVLFAPQVSLIAVDSLDNFIILQHNHHEYQFEEQTDALIQCQINSNPLSSQIAWYANGKILVSKSIEYGKRSYQNNADDHYRINNIFLHNNINNVTTYDSNKYKVKVVNGTISLQINKLNKSDSDSKYWCEATNKLATVSSNHITLKVLAKPKCIVDGSAKFIDNIIDLPEEWKSMNNYSKLGGGSVHHLQLQSVHFVELDTKIELKCLVDSNIATPELYQWQFINFNENNNNNSYQLNDDNSTTSVVINNNRPSTIKVTSDNILNYVVQEYGMIDCQAKNAIGLQDEPCHILIMPVSAPDKLKECHMSTEYDFNSDTTDGSMEEYKLRNSNIGRNDFALQVMKNISSLLDDFKIDLNKLRILFQCDSLPFAEGGQRQSRSVAYHLDVYYCCDESGEQNNKTTDDRSTSAEDDNLVKILQLNSTMSPQFSLNLGEYNHVLRHNRNQGRLMFEKNSKEAANHIWLKEEQEQQPKLNLASLDELYHLINPLSFYLYASNILGPGSPNHELDGASIMSDLVTHLTMSTMIMDDVVVGSINGISNNNYKDNNNSIYATRNFINNIIKKNQSSTKSDLIDRKQNATMQNYSSNRSKALRLHDGAFNTPTMSKLRSLSTNANNNSNINPLTVNLFSVAPTNNKPLNENDISAPIGSSKIEAKLSLKWWLILLLLSSLVCISMSIFLLIVGLAKLKKTTPRATWNLMLSSATSSKATATNSTCSQSSTLSACSSSARLATGASNLTNGTIACNTNSSCSVTVMETSMKFNDNGNNKDIHGFMLDNGNCLKLNDREGIDDECLDINSYRHKDLSSSIKSSPSDYAHHHQSMMQVRFAVNNNSEIVTRRSVNDDDINNDNVYTRGFDNNGMRTKKQRQNLDPAVISFGSNNNSEAISLNTEDSGNQMQIVFASSVNHETCRPQQQQQQQLDDKGKQQSSTSREHPGDDFNIVSADVHIASKSRVTNAERCIDVAKVNLDINYSDNNSNASLNRNGSSAKTISSVSQQSSDRRFENHSCASNTSSTISNLAAICDNNINQQAKKDQNDYYGATGDRLHLFATKNMHDDRHHHDLHNKMLESLTRGPIDIVSLPVSLSPNDSSSCSFSNYTDTTANSSLRQVSGHYANATTPSPITTAPNSLTATSNLSSLNHLHRYLHDQTDNNRNNLNIGLMNNSIRNSSYMNNNFSNHLHNRHSAADSPGDPKNNYRKHLEHYSDNRNSDSSRNLCQHHHDQQTVIIRTSPMSNNDNGSMASDYDRCQHHDRHHQHHPHPHPHPHHHHIHQVIMRSPDSDLCNEDNSIILQLNHHHLEDRIDGNNNNNNNNNNTLYDFEQCPLSVSSCSSATASAAVELASNSASTIHQQPIIIVQQQQQQASVGLSPLVVDPLSALDDNCAKLQLVDQSATINEHLVTSCIDASVNISDISLSKFS